MATAALLKIDPKIAAGIRNYIAQILQNPNANDRLKASLILEAMGKYNVTVNTISDATGYKIETINQYLSQAISPIEKISFIPAAKIGEDKCGKFADFDSSLFANILLFCPLFWGQRI